MDGSCRQPHTETQEQRANAAGRTGAQPPPRAKRRGQTMAEQDQRAQVRETGDLRDQAQHHERQRRIRITAIDELDEKRQERSEEHTSELQSLMRISYAVFCLKKKNQPKTQHTTTEQRR